jgi:hypothetical protein
MLIEGKITLPADGVLGQQSLMITNERRYTKENMGRVGNTCKRSACGTIEVSHLGGIIS